MITFENYTEPYYHIKTTGDVIIGTSESMLDLFMYTNHLAQLPMTVLLRGETGTGKELFAKALHHNREDKHKQYPFVAVNCAGIPTELLESELFGHVRGSFTGAHRDKIGQFQSAHKGTIFLDEIGDMSPLLQTKVLRALQERVVVPVGSNTPVKIDVRVIAATNKNLEDEVKNSSFRPDLYYRLNVVPLNIPSLKQRLKDIPFIAEHFLKMYNRQFDAAINGFTPQAYDKLMSAQWEGNVRELENVIGRLYVLKKSGLVQASDLYFNSKMPERIYMQSLEQELIVSEPHSHEEPQTVPSLLPITPRELSTYKGTFSYHHLLEKAADASTPHLTLTWSPHMHTHIAFLTQDNKSAYFKDTSTDDYKRLEELIETNPYNTVASQPHMFLSSSELLRTSQFKDSHSLKNVVQESGAYSFRAGFGFCLVVDEQNSTLFYPDDINEHFPLGVQDTIRTSYDAFVQDILNKLVSK